MRITRVYTRPKTSPYADMAFRVHDVVMKNPDGTVVYEHKNVEVPANWSDVACDVLVQKYFRKAGVPQKLKKAGEKGVPAWLSRSVAASPKTQGETLAKQVFDRLAGAWTY